MSKAVKILFGGAVLSAAIFGINKAVKATQMADAVSKLDIKISQFSVEKADLENIIVGIKLKANNPTVNNIEISQPYIKVSIPTKAGWTQIANTAIPSSSQLVIKAKDTNTIEQELAIPTISLKSIIPNIGQYLIDRVTGSSSSKHNVKVDFTAEVLGLTISNSQIVAI